MKTVSITLPLLFLAGLAAAPAEAADPRCTTLPDNIRAALPAAEPQEARTAARYLASGEQLCAARNKRAAAEQFRAAADLLGLDEDGRRPAEASAELRR